MFESKFHEFHAPGSLLDAVADHLRETSSDHLGHASLRWDLLLSHYVNIYIYIHIDICMYTSHYISHDISHSYPINETIFRDTSDVFVLSFFFVVDPLSILPPDSRPIRPSADVYIYTTHIVVYDLHVIMNT